MIGLILALSLAAGPPADDLEALVAHALQHHPDVAAAVADGDAARAGVRRAGSLPDPQLRWAEMLEPVQTRVGPQQRVLGVQQSLPWPGTLDARRQAAVQRGLAADESVAAVRVRVAGEVRRAWARAAWLSATLEVTRQQLALMRSLEESVRAAYEAGTGRYGDLLQAQLQVARLDDRLRGLQDQTEVARARLNAALGRDAHEPLDLPRDLDDGLVAAEVLDPPAHPELLALAHRVEAAQREVDAARRAGRPVMTLGLDWIMVGEAAMADTDGSGQDALVARLGISLPLWRGKHDGARQAATARAGALSARQTARRHALQTQVTAAQVARQDAARRLALHRDELLPRARQAYDAVLAAYQADGSGFAAVLAAQRDLLELEQGLLAARRDLLLAAADLDQAVGVVPASR